MTLLAPAFLAALALFALPWWLHRRSPRDPPARPNSSLMLLKAGEAPISRRRRLQNLALLACRLALITLLAFAFANPIIERAAAGGALARPAPVVVVDASLSMAREGVWAQALREARRVIDDLPSGVPALLVRAAEVVELVEGPTSDRERLRAAVGTLRPGAARLTLDGLVERIEALAAPRLGDAALDIRFVTDAQATAFPEQFNRLLGRRSQVTVHPTSGDEANVAIERLSVVSSDRPGRAYELRSIVRLFGSAPEEVHGELAVRIDGSEVARQPLSVGEGAPVEVTVPVREVTRTRLRATAAASIEAEVLVPDVLPADNVRRAVLVTEAVRPLPLVTGNPDGSDLAYVTAAVAASRELGYSPAHIETRSLETHDWSPARVLVLSDPVMSEHAVERLDRHLRGGAAALLVLGPNAAASGRVPLTGERVDAHSFGGGGQHVVLQARGHPALESHRAWREVRVQRALRYAEPPRGEVLLQLDDGTPLLIEQRRGAGRLLVLTSAIDRDWNDLSVRPVFVVFLADALRWLSPHRLTGNVTAGDLLSLAPGPAQVYAPDGTRVLSLADAQAGRAPRLHELGFYEIHGGGGVQLVAANPDVRESNLATDAPLLERWEAATRESAVAPAQAFELEPSRLPLAPGLLALLVALVALEALAANRWPHAARWTIPAWRRGSA